MVLLTNSFFFFPFFVFVFPKSSPKKNLPPSPKKQLHVTFPFFFHLNFPLYISFTFFFGKASKK